MPVIYIFKRKNQAGKWNTRHKLQDTSCKTQVASCKTQARLRPGACHCPVRSAVLGHRPTPVIVGREVVKRTAADCFAPGIRHLPACRCRNFLFLRRRRRFFSKKKEIGLDISEIRGILLAITDADVAEWQTRCVQVAVSSRRCRFNSYRRHHFPSRISQIFFFPA